MNTQNEQQLIARNAELEKELAAKNRELEIEAALKKVRAIAMGLKQPADMLEVCKTIFGQDNKLVKYWNFKGTHTAVFFGIPATGKTVSLDGSTVVRMPDGKTAEERDFLITLIL